MTVNTDLFVRNVIELDAAIKGGKKTAIDKKIKEFVQELSILKPEVAPQISEILEKADISHLPTHSRLYVEFFNPEGVERLKGVEKDLLTIVSKAMPELDIQAKLNQQIELAKAIIEAQNTKNTSQLEKILKESVELNVTSQLDSHTWLALITNLPDAPLSFRVKLLKLFLQSGAQISDDSKAARKSKNAVLDFVFRPGPNILDRELLELLILRGFDLNKDGDNVLRMGPINTMSPMLVFYGAGRKGETYSSAKAAIAFREKVLQDLNKNLAPEKQLDVDKMTFSQRCDFAKRCLILFRFTNEWPAHIRGNRSIEAYFKEASFEPPPLMQTEGGSLELPPLTPLMPPEGGLLEQPPIMQSEGGSLEQPPLMPPEGGLLEQPPLIPPEGGSLEQPPLMPPEGGLLEQPPLMPPGGGLLELPPLGPPEDASMELPPLGPLSFKPAPLVLTDTAPRKEHEETPPIIDLELDHEIQNLIREHEAFLKAFQAGDLVQAGKLLKAGHIDINTPLMENDRGMFVPLLVNAFEKGNLPQMEWLLEAGANPNVFKLYMDRYSFEWQPPLISALLRSDTPSHVVDLLLKYGADINGRNVDGKPFIMDHFKQLIEKDPQQNLARLVSYGLDLNLSYEGRRLTDPIEQQDKFAVEAFGARQGWSLEQTVALIDYGYDVAGTRPQLRELTDQELAKMVKAGLLKEEALMMMPAELIGVIVSFQPVSKSDLTAKIINDNVKLRDEIFAQMVKEGILQIQVMTRDVAGVIESYKPITLADLSPADRKELAKRCAIARAKASGDRIMSVNPDSFIRNMIELDAAIHMGNKEDVVTQIQKLTKEISTLPPEVLSRISKVVEKADISHIPTNTTYGKECFIKEGIERLKDMEKDILAIVSTAMPALNIQAKLDHQIKKQTELAQAIIEAQKTKNTASLEKILKESVDLNVPSQIDPSCTWLGVIANLSGASRSFRAKLLKLFLQSGAQLSEDTEAARRSKKDVLNLVFNEFQNVLDRELLELLILRGFDLNKDGDYQLRNAPGEFHPMLVFYGAGKKDENYYPKAQAARVLREKVLLEMNRHLPSDKQIDPDKMTLSQRSDLAKRCLVLSSFPTELEYYIRNQIARKAASIEPPSSSLALPPLIKPVFVPRPLPMRRMDAGKEIEPEEPKIDLEVDLAVQNLIKEHEAFLKAYQEGDLDQAGKLLKDERIIIDTPLVVNDRGIFIPLLVDAFEKGNLPLMEWLLKAGANPNAIRFEGWGWQPPLITALVTPNVNPAILDLLMKFGADINARNGYGEPFIMHHFKKLIDKDPHQNLGRLVSYGLDLNLSFRGKRLTDSIEPVLDLEGMGVPKAETWSLDQIIAFIDYGYDVTETKPKLRELTDQELAKMVKAGLMKEDALLMMSADIVGMIASFEPISKSDLTAKIINDAVKLRDEIFAQMVKEGILEIQVMTRDVAGLIESYKPITLADLSPADRMELAKRCAQARAKAS